MADLGISEPEVGGAGGNGGESLGSGDCFETPIFPMFFVVRG